MTFTLGEIFIGILFLLGMALLIITFIAILKLIDILKQVNTIVAKNEGNINASLDSMPKVLHNVEEITAGLNEQMQHISGTVRSIEETVEYAASTAQVLTEDIVLPIGELLQIFGLLKGIFIKEKKKGLFRK